MAANKRMNLHRAGRDFRNLGIATAATSQKRTLVELLMNAVSAHQRGPLQQCHPDTFTVALTVDFDPVQTRSRHSEMSNSGSLADFGYSASTGPQHVGAQPQARSFSTAFDRLTRADSSAAVSTRSL